MIAAAYLGVFLVFFWSIHGGVGQFWDWSSPYFADHMQNLFANKASSWTGANQGSPLGYSSDYFIRFAISLLGFLPPETVRYGLLAAIFAGSSFGIYLIAKRHTLPWVAFLIGLVGLINPAMFYKYTAGHFNYLIAFMLLIFMLYFMFYKFKGDVRGAVLIGLLFALMGAQIQFFVIGGLFLLTYYCFNRKQLPLRAVAIILLLPVLINAVWLANFVSGAASASDIGSAAAKVSFKSLSGSDFLSVFTFSFAKATLLTKFYALYELLWNACIFILLLWLLVREKRKETTDVLLLTFLAIMIFMATGLFQALPLGPITMIYPMLREVGHFAPIIVLCALLLMARMVTTSRWRWALVTVLAGSLLMVGIKFQYFSQGYSFADVRSQFAPFKEFADKDTSDYRILSYPFFDQYSFNKLAKDPAGTTPLKNSGHDSFAAFSGQQYIQNAIAPHKFQDSMQYKLLQGYDIDVLRPYNVKYIFDFSSIYESNYERYVPPTVYNNDVSLIKNDKQFFEKLLAANPGKLKRVNDHILQITDYTSRVQATDGLFAISDDEAAASAGVFTRQAFDRALSYTTAEEVKKQGLERYVTNLTTLFEDSHTTRVDAKEHTATQTLTPPKDSASTLYINREHDTVFYRTTGSKLVIYTQSSGQLALNGQPLYGSDDTRVIGEISLSDDTQYYASFKGKVIPLKPGVTGRLGLGEKNDTIDLLTSVGDNLVANASFESGLWQPKVNDCNNYDTEHNARIGMRQTRDTASEGQAALLLEAEKHDACTYTAFDLEGNSQYLVQYDYQSTNAKTSSFHLSYDKDDEALAHGAQTVRDASWDTYTSIVDTDEQRGKARLYLYALEQSGQKTINRYDNVQITKLQKVATATVPGASKRYESVPLPATSRQEFTILDTNQQYKNLIPNPSFEQGSWQKKVSDCRNYDNDAQLGMRITKLKSDGKQALELSATRHDACVRATTDITAGTDYRFSFDYQGQKGKYYAYAISFDDPNNSIDRQQIAIPATGTWQTQSVRVHAPARASTATVYLYALEAGDQSKNVITYDNVQLTEIPDFVDRFYVTTTPKTSLKPPKSLHFETSTGSRRSIEAKGVSTPFFVNLSETYHPSWRLELASGSVSGPLNSWRPGSAGVTAAKHFKTDNYANGWLVDPQQLCGSGSEVRSECTKNKDGSYDIKLIAEFVPQRWFTVAATISWITLISAIIYIIAGHSETEESGRRYRFRRNRKQ